MPFGKQKTPQTPAPEMFNHVNGFLPCKLCELLLLFSLIQVDFPPFFNVLLPKAPNISLFHIALCWLSALLVYLELESPRGESVFEIAPQTRRRLHASHCKPFAVKNDGVLPPSLSYFRAEQKRPRRRFTSPSSF